jgi:diketogulonate reductase-like aldo/keto reductase
MGPMDNLLSTVKIGLGVGGIGEGKEAGILRDEDYVLAIQEAYEIGYRLFDTAEAYSDGRSEKLVGSALDHTKTDAIVATKVSPNNLRPGPMQSSAESSLKRLNRDCIDLYQIHWPNPEVRAEEVAEGIYLLYQRGLIRSVGVCNYTSRQAEELKALLPDVPFLSSQVELSLVDQYPLGRVHDWALRERVATLAYSPLGKGRIAKVEALDSVLSRIAGSFNASKAQVSLAWLASLGGVIPIPASRNQQHLRENFNFSSISMGLEDLDKISEALVTDEVSMVRPAEIQVALDGEGSRLAYTTLAEAKENKLDFCPSPESLSREILLDRDIKPVRIQIRSGELFLVEGRVRFWAWVIAFGFDDPIPCTILSEVVR